MELCLNILYTGYIDYIYSYTKLLCIDIFKFGCEFFFVFKSIDNCPNYKII